MAVSGKGPAPREVPYAVLGDTPDAEAEGKAVAEKLSNYASFGVGLLAARPAAEAKNEGHIYWATDDTTFGPNGTWWISYSAAWHEAPLMTVTTALLAALSVTTAKLGEESVTEPKLGAEAVSESKLKNLAVTAAKIAANTITAAKIAAEAIETAGIKNLAVTAGKLAAEAVETAKIKAEAVTGPKLGAETFRILAASTYSAQVSRTSGEEFEPSATRPTFVSLQTLATGEVNAFLIVWVGGVLICNQNNGKESNPQMGFSFICPPKQKWKATCNTGTLDSSYLTL